MSVIIGVVCGAAVIGIAIGIVVIVRKNKSQSQDLRFPNALPGVEPQPLPIGMQANPIHRSAWSPEYDTGAGSLELGELRAAAGAGVGRGSTAWNADIYEGGSQQSRGSGGLGKTAQSPVRAWDQDYTAGVYEPPVAMSPWNSTYDTTTR